MPTFRRNLLLPPSWQKCVPQDKSGIHPLDLSIRLCSATPWKMVIIFTFRILRTSNLEPQRSLSLFGSKLSSTTSRFLLGVLGEVSRGQLHAFPTLALGGSEWSASWPNHFIPGKRFPGTHWIGNWVGPRASLDTVEKRKISSLPGIKPQIFGHPAHSLSLQWLSYPRVLSVLLEDMMMALWNMQQLLSLKSVTNSLPITHHQHHSQHCWIIHATDKSTRSPLTDLPVPLEEC
jgi:hypothetical protein